eukprot:GFYU01011442.1.p1 GENE.GFYU01011442.1~~GFYU01011442.1.p1  ORF type:complete len:301 (+),score=78.87 GFYU01011442.1:33-935(+)
MISPGTTIPFVRDEKEEAAQRGRTTPQWFWILNCVMFISLVVMNVIGGATKNPFGGRSNGEVSGLYQTSVTPAGFAFSIWGLIYFSVGAFTVWQALPSQRNNPRVTITMGWLWPTVCVLNCIWLPTFAHEVMILALIIIAAYLGVLFTILVRIDITDQDNTDVKPQNWQDLAFVRFPISLQTGWLTVATIANFSIVLVDNDVKAANESDYSICCIALIGTIGLFMLSKFGDVTYTGVLIWALLAINNKQGERLPPVGSAATGVAFTLLALACLRLALNAMLVFKQSRPGSTPLWRAFNEI